jgi:hypothetical protein
VREFVYRTGKWFTVSDEVETTNPAVITFLLHADNRVEKADGGRFSIKAGEVKLLIDPTIDLPNEPGSAKQIQSEIETNTLTAPGPPGAVDKGEHQARGQKLLLSTAVPATRVRFILRLSLED